MFNPDFHLDVPTGGDLLAEIGLDPRAISEVIEDDRSMRCPDRGAVFPERRSRTSSRQRPHGRRRGVEEGFRRMNGRGPGGENPVPDVRNPSSSSRP